MMGELMMRGPMVAPSRVMCPGSSRLAMMNFLLAVRFGGLPPVMPPVREGGGVSSRMTVSSHRVPMLLPTHVTLLGRHFMCWGMKSPLDWLPTAWGHRHIIVLLIILIFNARHLKGGWPFLGEGKLRRDTQEKESNEKGGKASAAHVGSRSYLFRWVFKGYFPRIKASYVGRTLW